MTRESICRTSSFIIIDWKERCLIFSIVKDVFVSFESIRGYVMIMYIRWSWFFLLGYGVWDESGIDIVAVWSTWVFYTMRKRSFVDNIIDVFTYLIFPCLCDKCKLFSRGGRKIYMFNVSNRRKVDRLFFEFWVYDTFFDVINRDHCCIMNKLVLLDDLMFNCVGFGDVDETVWD